MNLDYAMVWTDRRKNRLLRWEPGSSQVTDISPGSNHLRDPYGLAIKNGDLVVANKHAHCLERIHQGAYTVIPTHDAKGERQGRISALHDRPAAPTSVAVDPDGALLVVYSGDHTIYRVLENGALELELGVPSCNGMVIGPCSDVDEPQLAVRHPLHVPTQAIRRKNGSLTVIERGYQVVRSWRRGGPLRCLFPLRNRKRWIGRATLVMPDVLPMDDYHPSFPTALATDAQDRLFLADAEQKRVWRLDEKAGIMETVVRSISMGPGAITIASDGMLWVVDGDGIVRGYSPATSGLWPEVSASPATERGKWIPQGSGLVCVPTINNFR